MDVLKGGSKDPLQVSLGHHLGVLWCLCLGFFLVSLGRLWGIVRVSFLGPWGILGVFFGLPWDVI